MMNADRLKEEIGWMKIPFGLLIVIDASLLGWLAQYFATASAVLVVAAGIALIAVTGVVFWIDRTARQRIAELREN